MEEREKLLLDELRLGCGRINHTTFPSVRRSLYAFRLEAAL